ncbi:MAG: hypothetical protein KA354_24945 [Phycisphaerae bacterium]|nr:hypothetical protein [Phycisphaerae bacterium]
MSKFNIETFKWVGRLGVGSATPEILDDPDIKEANNQTFKAGDLVYLSSGTVTKWADSATTQIAGIALEDATNVTSGNKAIKILKITSMDIFEGTFWDTSESQAITAVTIIGQSFGLDTPSAGVWVVDNDSTNDRVRVVGLKKGPAFDSTGTPCQMKLGDTYGRVYVQFLDSTSAGTELLMFN